MTNQVTPQELLEAAELLERLDRLLDWLNYSMEAKPVRQQGWRRLANFDLQYLADRFREQADLMTTNGHPATAPYPTQDD